MVRISTSAAGSAKGSGSRIQAFTIVKVMVGPAIPSAIVVSATAANPGLWRSVLEAY